MTVKELLLANAPYQIPEATLVAFGEEAGVDIYSGLDDVNPVLVYRARARMYLFLATLPNVSEGGVSISFTESDKRTFLALAKKYAKLGDEAGLIPGAAYGYKGQNL